MAHLSDQHTAIGVTRQGRVAAQVHSHRVAGRKAAEIQHIGITAEVLLTQRVLFVGCRRRTENVNVIPRSTIERVIAGSAFQPVVGRVARDRIVAGTSGHVLKVSRLIGPHYLNDAANVAGHVIRRAGKIDRY